MKDEREIQTHPSFGMISITRSYGGKNRFFGSELEVDHYITLKIAPAERQRDLSNDWYYASHKSFIEVAMTAIQFAEMITNAGVGDGVPCTIQYLDGKRVEQEHQFESKKETTHKQFKQRMKEFAGQLVQTRDKAVDIVKKKTLSKEDQHNLNMHLQWLTQEISSNIPFFMECFQETADRVVAEAKSEVEAAITHRINTLGLEQLHQQNKLLGDGK